MIGREIARLDTHVPKLFFMGIDPGKQGGIVCLPVQQLSHLYAAEVQAHPMPTSVLDVWNLFDSYKDIVTSAYIEQVNSMPGEGHRGAFTFGMGYGMLQMALAASGIPHEFVTPRTWQKGLGIKAKGTKEPKPQFKERLRVKAQQLFPQYPLWGVKGTLGKQRAVCDAMLIAEYCRRKHEGLL